MKNSKSTIIFVATILLVVLGLYTYKISKGWVKSDNIDVSKVVLNETFFSSMKGKELIHYKIMNSIDFFSSATGKFLRFDLPSKLEEEITYQVDVKNRRSYYHTTNADKTEDLEILSNNGIKFELNNISRNYMQNKLQVLAKDEDIKKLKPVNRFSKKNGYIARDDNEYLLGTGDSLFNQTIASSYLKNYNNWSISGEEKYLGRDSVKIVGVLDFTGKSHENNFIILVDKTTGIILKSEDLDINGKVIYSLTTTEIEIDEGLDKTVFEKTTTGYSKGK